MCLAPITLPDGKEAACRECSQCRSNKVNDWVGRSIAESKTAVATHAVTLTYGRGRLGDVDHERSAILTFSDVQKFLKLLRRHGFPVRYLVAGEYGSARGRAHWHIILWWQAEPPAVELDKNVMFRHWPHGFSFWRKADGHAARYVCKYILKDMNDVHGQSHLSMSKKPPIGSEYFRTLAERYVAQGLAPQSLEYTFPGESTYRRQRDGAVVPVKYRLTGRSAELFLDHFMASWNAAYPGKEWPKSRLIEEYCDGALKERRRINEWFAALPPKLSAAQRLDCDRLRARLEELDAGPAREAAWAERMAVAEREAQRRKARPRYWHWDPVVWEQSDGQA